MKFFIFLLGIGFGTVTYGSGLMASESTLVCIEGKPFLEMWHLERRCGKVSHPYFSSLVLTADSMYAGAVDFTVDWSLEFPDSVCDNPRGHYVVHHLPLPISDGLWEIFEKGEFLGEVSFLSALPCRIKAGSAISM